MNVAGCLVKSTVRTIFHYVCGSCSTALLMAAGDVLIQYHNGAMVQDLKKVDWQRTAKFSLIGFCFMGPVLTYWSSIVKSAIGPGKSHNLLRTLKHMICDQIFLAPSLNLGVVTLAAVTNYESVVEIEKRIAEDFPYIIKRHYMLWPAAQFFGNICIQPSLQRLFANSVAIIWFAFISGILHKDKNMTRLMETEGLLMAAGDILSQTYSEKCNMENIDYQRTAKFATIGFIFAGPLMAHWKGVMGKSINGTILSKALKKTLNTQTFMAPSLNFGIISLAAILNNGGVTPTKTDLENELKGDFLNIMTNNYILWLPTQFFGKLLGSSIVQFLAINAVSVVWFAHLSSILMKATREDNKLWK